MVEERIVRTTVRVGDQPTEAMRREIEMAAESPVIPDEDSPVLTMEQYAEMAEIVRKKRAEKVKPVVALSVSPDTLAEDTNI